MPRALNDKRSNSKPKIKAAINSQFALSTTVRQSKTRKIKGIVVRLTSKIKANSKRIIARNFIGN
jgi:hypothetical protein